MNWTFNTYLKRVIAFKFSIFFKLQVTMFNIDMSNDCVQNNPEEQETSFDSDDDMDFLQGISIT